MSKIFLFFFLILNIFYYSCYTVSASLFHKDTHSIYIPSFTNQSDIINPFIGNEFSLELQEKFLKNTNLIIMNDKLADLIITGNIISYNIILNHNSDISNQNNNIKHNKYNRLSIHVNISYISKQEPNKNFNKIFSNYIDFQEDCNINHPIMQYQIIPLLKKKIINQIFEEITINW